MIVANSRYNAEFPYAPEHAGSNIVTASVVTEIFREEFFPPVRRCEARLDRYLRNVESLTEYLNAGGLLRK